MFLRSCANAGTGLIFTTCQKNKMNRMGMRLLSKSFNGDLIASFYPLNTLISIINIIVVLIELNDLIVKLDAAADVAAKSVPTFTPERKQRVVSPPADAPDWAVQPEYRKSEFNIAVEDCHDCFIFTCRPSIE